MNKQNIAFLGAGNMARSIIGGLIAEGYPPANLRATARSLENQEKIQSTCQIQASADNSATAKWADIIVLGAKPQGLKDLCDSIAGALTHKPLIVSIAAGIDCASLNKWLGGNLAIVRAMPNTPALVKQGATGLFANAEVTPEQQAQVDAILTAVGVTAWVKEEPLIDVVTAISGSGPAYYFLFMEAMTEAGTKLGLDAETAKQLTIQTALGAAHLAKAENIDLQQLRQQVTSPGGTTEQAILSFEANNLRATVDAAMQACTNQAQTLAKAFGKNT